MRDSARIQEQDARFYSEKIRGDHDPEIVPLYTEEDAKAVQPFFIIHFMQQALLYNTLIVVITKHRF